MQLSQHFSFEELTRTEHRDFLNENRALAHDHILELTRLCTEVLEPARAIIGVPLIVQSGYRCPNLNAAIGGSRIPPSRHMLGEAADTVYPGIDVKTAFNRLAWAEGFRFGQIILEFNEWVHLSIIDEVRYPGATMQRLMAIRKNGQTIYEPVGARL